MRARSEVLARIAVLDGRIRSIAKRHGTDRLPMTAPADLGFADLAVGAGPVTALAVVAAFDDASRFRRASRTGACPGSTPRRCEPGEVSRNGRISKRGDAFTRKCLYEAANAIHCRNLGGPRLRGWARAIAERTGPRKAKVALAREPAVTLHAMWRTGTPFREATMAWRSKQHRADPRRTGMRPAGTHGEGEIVPGTAAPPRHHRPRTPLRSARPRTQTCGTLRGDRGENPRARHPERSTDGANLDHGDWIAQFRTTLAASCPDFPRRDGVPQRAGRYPPSGSSSG